MLILIVSWSVTLTVATKHHHHHNDTPPHYRLNVGTTLFRPSDVTRACWSPHEVALLKARRATQALIPADMCIDSDEHALAVEEYIRIVARVVEHHAPGPARLMMLRAVADALGGWLHVRALPRARAAFYAGHLSYDPTRRLHSLLEEMRSLLLSDGQFWRPVEHIRPITLKARRQRRSEDVPAGCASLLVRGSGGEVRVPLPFLDNPARPSVVALPVKGRVLVSLDDPEAESLLVHFHDAAEACLAGTPQAEKFHEEMQRWLREEVSPLLAGEHWYPALGGVAALMDDSRGAGGVAGPDPAGARHRLDTWRHAEPPRGVLVAGEAPPAQLPVGAEPGSSGGVARFFHSLSSWELAALLVASALLVWLKVAFCYVIASCFRRRRKQSAPLVAPRASGGSAAAAARRSSPSASSSSSSSGRASILSALVSVLGGAVSPPEPAPAAAQRSSALARSSSQQRRSRQSSSGSRSRSSTSLSQPSVIEARQPSQ